MTISKKLSRDGKKQISGYFEPEVQKAVRQLALDEDTNVQTLVGEGINLVFEKRGKEPPVKPDNDP